MAQRGAPLGNNNNVKNKPWAEALARINIQSEGAKLRKIAEKLYEMAEAGDIQAIREIADRCDGKAAQSVAVTGDEGGPITFEKIVREIVRPTD